MLNQKNIGAVCQTSTLPLSHFEKYVKIAAETKGKKVNPKVLREIEAEFRKANSSLNKAAVEKVLGQVIQKMNTNQALVEMTLDHNGEKSRFFFPWLVLVWTSQSTALEPAYGFGYDCEGNRLLIPKDDPMFPFINDPTFVFTRLRSYEMARLVAERQGLQLDGEKLSILDVCAGRIPWLKYCRPKNAHIRAYDRDKTIPVDEFAKIGVEYHIDDMMTGINDPANKNTDLVFMAGVLSYLTMEQIVGILAKVYELLTPGGTFFFDVQLDCVYLRRSMAVFGWDTLSFLPSSFEQAIVNMETIRKKLIEYGVHYSAEYAPDTINEVPAIAMIKFTKK